MITHKIVRNLQRFRCQPTIQLETALCNKYCFCNTELRTATVPRIKGLSIQTQQNMFVLFTLFKLTLDERKTLTKISTRNLSQQFPQTSACFGHDGTSKTSKTAEKPENPPCTIYWKKNQQKALCIIGGESRGIRISSRNNERIKTTNRNDGKFCENFRIGFVSNLHYF